MSLKKAAESVRRAGRENDTELVHLTKGEVKSLKGLAAAAGGELTHNPKTGLLEAGFLQNMLPTILGAAAMMVPGMQPLGAAAIGAGAGALTNKEDPWGGAMMGGIGAFGGANIASGLQGLGATAVSPEAMAAANASTDPIMSVAASKDAATAAGATVPAGTEAAGAGLQNAMNNPQGLATAMGGTTPALKAGAAAAAPAFYQQVEPGDEWKPKSEGERKYNYEAGYTGGTQTGADPSSERTWFTPRYTPMAQGGLVAAYAAGGEVAMEENGFVIPADVVSMVGNGSSNAGLEALARTLGAQPLDGPGDGLSDDIPARINGKTPARVARQEAYLSPAQVERAGGAQKLYALMDRVRHQAHGTPRQQRPVDLREALA